MAEVSQTDQVNSNMDTNGAPDSIPEMDYASPEEGNEVCNIIPAQIEKMLDFLLVSKGGVTLLGSSNLTGRYWCGSLWLFRDVDDAPDVEKAVTGIEFNGGIVDAVFCDDNFLMIAEDGGIIDFVCINNHSEGGPQFLRTNQIEEHSDNILSIAVSCDKKTAFSSSWDCSVCIYDTKTTATVRVLHPAHLEGVSCVAPHPTHADLFLTSSYDGNVLLWDLRKSKPASCVFRDVSNAPTCVTWIGEAAYIDGESSFLVGTWNGLVALRSLKSISDDVSRCSTFCRAIHRFTFSPESAQRAAVCADETKVAVVDIQQGEIVLRFEDDLHDDFVRGLTWTSPNCFYSCGWDKRVIKHSVS